MREVIHSDILRMLADSAQIVDVLPSHEYRAAHIRGAIHLPLHRILRDATTALDRTRPVAVYCRDNL